MARVLDHTRAWNSACYELSGFGHYLVEGVGVDEHEGRDLDRGQDGTNVRMEIAAQLRCETAGGNGGAGVAAEPIALAFVWGIPPVERAPGVADRLDLLRQRPS